MSSEIDYGNLTKQNIFWENDHRQAQLILRCRHDGLTQSAFFRHIITAYITGDDRIQNYIDEVKVMNEKRKKKSKALKRKGEENCNVSECRLWVNFEEDHNCCLISIYEHGAMTLREVAKRLGISFARVKQIETKALKKLKEHPDATTLFF